VKLHRVQVGDGPLREIYLCEGLHGKYWPQVGESAEKAAERTKRARSRFTGGAGNKALAEERRRAARERGRARRQLRPVEDVDLENEEVV
jgi:hypothetical protein